MSSRFYVTTTLPYVNSEPHIGFAAEVIRADIIVRYQKMIGKDVFFNTGTDEHGQKIYQKALSLGKDPQAYVDEWAEKFQSLKELLNLWAGLNFVRTTDAHHVSSAQEFWRRCEVAGDIYKKNYKVKYCVGCELEKTESELEGGKCPLHPNLELEIREEENYFFRFSKYQNKLLTLYDEQPDFVLPATRLKEIRSFVEKGLEDFSISRLASKMPWGVPVPNDSEQVMYVWFDALVNYISVLGWPEDEESFDHWWIETGGAVQYCGKDNLRQQAAMWQAMLMSAGLTSSKNIIINGFITSGGQKMSKSLGNVVSPLDVVSEYGAETLRYFVARELSQFEDSDYSPERFKETYNANLANGLGNLVSRIMRMAQDNLSASPEMSNQKLPQEFCDLLDNFEINKAVDLIWQKIGELDVLIQTTQPFKLVKEKPEEGKKIIAGLITSLAEISLMLRPIMPKTAQTIEDLIKNNQMPSKPLFLRKN